MDQQLIRSHVLIALKSIAPEVEAERLRNDRPLREEVDLDSMDWLRFIAAVYQRVGVNIPEVDYQRVSTLDALITYLAQHGASDAEHPLVRS